MDNLAPLLTSPRINGYHYRNFRIEREQERMGQSIEINMR